MNIGVNQIKIVFRVDASIDIGSGHVMRCLTLADALSESGSTCHFICNLHEGHMIEEIRNKGHNVYPLSNTSAPINQPVSDETDYSSWLGTDWFTDAQQCREIVIRLKPDWLVVDHYALDGRWENAVLPQGCRLLVIDDLANRGHIADILLDQNWFGKKTTNRYDNLVPQRCIKFLGPQYALLKRDYFKIRQFMPPRDGFVRRVLIFLGGSDPTNQTSKALRALMEPNLQFLIVDVVIGLNHPDPEGITDLAKSRPATVLHKNVPNLAGLMARADLMIGAGGTTTWERMTLGLPSIVITIADNQYPINLALDEAGYVNHIGNMNEVESTDISEAIQHSLVFPEELKTQSNKMQRLVSGNGVDQLCKKIYRLV